MATVNRRGRPGFVSLRAAKNTCLLENGRAGGGGWSVADTRETFSSVLSFRAPEKINSSGCCVRRLAEDIHLHKTGRTDPLPVDSRMYHCSDEFSPPVPCLQQNNADQVEKSVQKTI